MVSKSPKWGYSPDKWPNSMAYKWGVILTTYIHWDDPPSGGTPLVSYDSNVILRTVKVVDV